MATGTSPIPLPGPGGLPDDPKRQNLDNIYAAWRITHGSATVKVAVIDTGVKTTHPDLQGRVVAEYDAATGGHTAPDVDGQGTAVASIIGASTGNGLGMSGMAGDTSLLAVRVSDSAGNISDTSLARGIDWSVSHGASVINISLYQPESDPSLKAAIARAVAKDVVVVAMAGDLTSAWQTYPAAYPGVLAVSTSTQNGVGPKGTWVDVAAAPNVVAAVAKTGGYATFTGSAYAAPQVAAIAALLRASHPEYSAAKVERVIAATATGSRNQSHPVPNVDAFRALADNLVLPGPEVVAPSPAAVVTGLDVDIQVHLPDFVPGDMVLAGLVGEPLVRSDPGSGDGSVDVPVFGRVGPQTVRLYGCVGGFCSTANPTLLAIDVEPAPWSFDFQSTGRPAGDLALEHADLAEVFANGVSLGKFRGDDSGEASLPVDRLPIGTVHLSASWCDRSGAHCDGPSAPPQQLTVARLENPTLTLSRASIATFASDLSRRTTRLTITVPDGPAVDTRLFLGVDPTVSAFVVSVYGEPAPTVDLGLLSAGTHTYDWKGLSTPTSGPQPVVVETVSPEGLVGRARASVYVDVIQPKLTPDQTRATVYPIRDGYRDSVTITGRTKGAGTLEAIITAKGGHVVARTHVPHPDSTYRLEWNGRSSTGAVLPAGDYRVALRSVDPYGATGPTSSVTVTVTHKRLVTRSKNIQLSPQRSSVPRATYYASGACSKVALQGTSGLRYRPCTHGWVETVHQVQLPSAVRYLRFQVAVTGVGKHAHRANLGYVAPGGYIFGWTGLSSAAGTHRATSQVVLDAGIWPNARLRWVLDDEDGDTYVATSFMASVRYQVLH